MFTFDRVKILIDYYIYYLPYTIQKIVYCIYIGTESPAWNVMISVLQWDVHMLEINHMMNKGTYEVCRGA